MLRALSNPNIREAQDSDSSRLDCSILEERLLLSASPLPILADVESIDAVDYDTGIDDLSDFDAAFDVFNTEHAQRSANHESGQLVIFDSDVRDADLLVADIQQQLAEDDSLWVEFLDADEDGIGQITEILDRFENLGALHIISHGQQGELRLGNTRLDIDSLDGHAGDISSWASALGRNADILLYGCEVAGDAEGELLVDSISELTGADVAASADLTGHQSLGGDWNLEYIVGELDAHVAFSAAAQAQWESSLATYTVTQTSGDELVAGTLAWAIEQANLNAGQDTIEFDIGSGGQQTIVLSKDLPTITESVIIDGTSQSGFAGAPIIEVNANGNDAFDLMGNDSAIKGLVINRTSGHAIELIGDNHVITGNYIGTDITGTIALGNGGAGVHIEANNNIVGGLLVADRNVIAASGDDGVGIGSGTNNSILGNYIGTDATGSVALGNSDRGIIVEVGANGQLIEGNVVSASGNSGIELKSTDNQVIGNFVGTDSTGSIALGNVANGIAVAINADGQLIQNNVVGASGFSGIDLKSQFNQVFANFLGTDSTGVVDLGNLSHGIWITNRDNEIGSAAATDGNTIAFNTGDGIRMEAGPDARNWFLSNNIFANDGLGINLVGGDETTIGSGVTVNSLMDNLQNYPILTSASYDGTDLTVEGTLTTAALVEFRVDVFASYSPDPSGYGEGEIYVGSFDASSDLLGVLTFSATTSGVDLSENATVTTTATQLTDFLAGTTVNGHTSEFSNSVAVNYDPPTVDLDSDDSVTAGIGFHATFTEGASAVMIADDDAAVTSVFDRLDSLTVVITNLSDIGDEFLAADTSGTSITANYNSNSGVLTLIGSDSVANYNQVIRTVTYENTSNSPNTTDRSITFVADDGNSTSPIATSTVSIVEIPASADRAWFSIISDSSYKESQVISVSDPGFSLEPTGSTTGSVGSVFDLAVYDTGANIDGLHYVSRHVTVGGTNFAAFDLLEGDLLFSVDSTISLPGVPIVTDADVILFRPDDLGDYTTGTFTMLLSDPIGQDVWGLSLVEVDTDMADITLDAGTFLFSHQGGGDHDKVVGYVAEDIGINTAVASSFVLIEGGNGNLGFSDEKIYALEFVEENTQVGGVLLTEGQILIGFEQDLDNLGGNGLMGSLRQHMVLFDLTTTVVGSGVSQGDASTIFDATDLGFTTNNEGLDAFTFVSLTNQKPVASSGGPYSVVEGSSVVLDASASNDVDGAVVSFEWDYDYDGITFDVDGTGITTVFDATLLDGPSSRNIAVRVTDDDGDTHIAITFVNVTNAAPTAVDDSGAGYTTDEDTAFSTPDITLNDSDPSPLDSLTVTSAMVTGGGGSVTVVGNQLVFDPGTDFQDLAVGESRLATIEYTISDEDGGSAMAIADVIVAGVNDDPIANGLVFSTDEDLPYSATLGVNDLLLNDTDLDGDTLTVNTTPVSGPSNGTLVLNANGTFSYTPNANFHGSDSFVYEVSDGNGGTAQATVNITINPVNDDPVAVNDAFATDEDTPYTATLGVNDLLLNDTDLDGDTLTVNTTPVSGPSNGTLVLNANGTFTYTPNANFHGSDSFVYEVSDGNGGTAQATVNITINPVNDDPVAVNDAFATDEDTPYTATLGVNDLLLNDTDLDGDTLTVNTTPVSGPSNGTLVLNGDGTFTYTPNANFHGSDVFVYEVSDGNGGTAQATVNITVNPINDDPAAVNDAFATDEDTPYTATLGANDLLLNDADLDGDTLTVNTTPVSGPSHGTLVLNGDGTFTYTPNANSSGSDVFVYEVSDGNGGTAQATVNITVNPINDDPMAVNDAFATDEDTPYTATLGVNDLLLNDTDLDGDTLTVNTTPVSGPSNGTLVLNGDGTFTYTPNATFYGSDLFVYEVSDGNGGTAQATVNITVNPINDDPVAVNDAFATDEDTPYTATLGVNDLLLNDADLDGDTLTVNTTPVSGPSNGTLVLNGDGTFTYTPNATFHGSDLFVYEVSDGNGGTAQATVNITVNPINDDPVAVNDAFATNEDTPYTATLGVNDLLLNDADLDGDTLTVNTTPVSGPSNGTLVLNGDGTFTYTPNANFSGSDSFVYEASDGNGGTAQATVNITVNPINDDPVAVNDAFATDEDTPYTATLGVNDLLLNDTDLDGDTLTVITTPVSGPSNGTLVLNGDGTFTYTPNAHFHSSDLFAYEVSDGNGGTAQATVNITVNPINDDPMAVNDAFATNEDTPYTATLGVNDLLLNDADLDGDTLTVNTTPVSGPSNGTLVLNGDGTFTYTPNANSSGSDSFVYEVSDGNGGTAQATVNITVNPINDDPVAVNDAFATDEDTPYTATLGVNDLLLNDADLDGDTLTVNTTPVSGPSNGTLVLNGDGTFTYTPNANFSGSDLFVYEVSDGNGGTAQATVNITVNPVNDDPVAVNDAFATDEDTPYTATLGVNDLLLNDADPDGDTLTVNATPVSGPSNGTLVLNGDGTFAYTPNATFYGSDSFVYEVSDGDGGTAQATVNITVNPINDDPMAINDAFATDEDTPYTATLGVNDLLLNDTDLDGDTLMVNTTPVSSSSNGTLVLNGDGTFTYTPNSNFNGSDSFVYEVSDGNGGTAQTTVNITVNPINDGPVAVNDAFTTDEGTSYTATLGANDLLLNDADLDGDTLMVNTTAVSGPSNGMLVLNGHGTFTYTPNANFNGSDSFVYEVSDGNGGTAQATVNITVNPINDDPVAVNDAFATDEDTPYTATPGMNDVLLNDTDLDGDTLTVKTTPVSGPSNGTLVLNGDGTFTYTPNANFNGSDSFVYEVSDGNGGTAQATVNITVNPINDDPVAVNDAFATDEDTSYTATLGVNDLLLNDADLDGDTLTVNATPVSGPSNGTLVLNTDGTFTYTPNEDFNGTDSFDYRTTDGEFESIATVVIYVNPVNDAPTLNTDTLHGFVVGNDTVLSVTESLLRFGDDVDLDDLTIQIVGQPKNGVLTVNRDGTFEFEPDQGFLGSDDFDFVVSDGLETSGVETVTIEVMSFVGNGIEDSGEDGGGTVDGTNDSGNDDELIAPPPILFGHLNNDDVAEEGLFDFLSRSTSDRTQITMTNVEIAEYEGVNTPANDSVFYASGNHPIDVTAVGGQRDLMETGRHMLTEMVHGFNFEDVAFVEALDSLQKTVKLDFPIELATLGATIATTGGMSVGYVLWTIRGGYLIGGLLSSQMPAWRLVDPLPIVDFLGNEDEEDHDSLETIIAAAKS